jgi:DNA-binding CsgD family transcriptional regulator
VKRLSNISRADWLLVAATVVAGLRMMLIHAVFIGFDLAQWPWFKGAEVWSGLAFALLEGVALAYVSRLWVGLRPQRSIDWVYWFILALGMVVMLASVIGVTSYAASSVRREAGIDALLGDNQAVAWSMFVTALNPLMVILIGIARAIDPREQQPTSDRPPWPPLTTQLDLFIQELGDQAITPDEAARKFAELTGLPVTTRQLAGALARRNVARSVAGSSLAQLSARVDESGQEVQGEVVQEGQGSEAITIRSERAGQADQVTQPLDLMTRRARVREMHGQGASQAEMARRLGVDPSTIKRDLRALAREAEAVQQQNKLVQQNGKVKVA